jgi:hypothetical protein
MADSRLFGPLSDVISRLRRQRSLYCGSIGWMVLSAVLLALLLLSADRMLILGVFAAGSVLVFIRGQRAYRLRPTDEREAALLIEKQYPELDSRLLTAIGQKPDASTWQFGYLQSELISEVAGHAKSHPWNEAISRSRSAAALLTNLTTMGLCLAVAVTVAFRTPPTAERAVALQPGEPVPIEEEAITLSVEPGDIELERGTSLLVIARFPDRLPREVELVAVDENERELRLPLRKSLDDPLFGGRLPSVDRDLTYRVEFDGRSSETYTVTTFDYPRLLSADAHVEFPEYTALPRRTIEDVRRFSVVEGSRLQLDCRLNKPVRSAVLIDDDGKRLELALAGDEFQLASGSWSPEVPERKRYRLELIDQEGRRNRDPEEFVVQVLPNNPPELKVSFPSRDTRVSPIQEVALEARASDDFGLLEYGLVYQTPDGTEQTVVLGGSAKATQAEEGAESPDQAGRKERALMQHLLALESLDVEPDQLLSYYFYADDVGPDGKPRRAFSDIFFAEVRPFEEIFRQAPSQPGQEQEGQEGEGAGGGPSQQLLELQKQIVTATWNLIRRENRPKPTAEFGEDAVTLVESQDQGREMATELAGELTDPLMQQYLGEAIEQMRTALDAFTVAATEESIEALPEGRKAAQQAYQALLRLNSREQMVQLQNQSQSQSASASASSERMNQQLQELELKNDRDRYETERQARQQQTQGEREMLQALNRLRELARRQEDLNEKIRELENKLRTAETEEERRELEHQLKRLQEEQQEMLRNLDELRERMDREENRQRMADAREQVDQTRERMLRSSEALEQGQTSQALTEGTRAQRELNDLQEDFRRRTAGQFDDAVRELRDDVRDLERRQEELAEAMRRPPEEETAPRRPSLRSEPETDNQQQEFAEDLRNQRERLRDVLDRTRELVEEAEIPEPLLSKKLYDTVRELRKHEPEEALEAASQLSRYGIPAEAQRAEEQAREGINRLRQGVDEAARSVLGDETEALRLAQSELSELTESIRRELEENDPNGTGRSDSDTDGERGGVSPPIEQPSFSTPGEQRDQERTGATPGERSSDSDEPRASGQRSPGERSEDQQPGESTEPGERSPGEPASGESSPGERTAGEPSDAGESATPSGERGEDTQEGQRGGSEADGSRAGGDLRDRLGSFFDEGGHDGGHGGGRGGPHYPLTGDAYREWSDRLRDIEEMLTTPELRAQASAIRDRARQMRIEVRKHAQDPNWELVRTSIYGPMLRLQEEMALELARRNPEEKLVPIDRDPVPDRYADLVREYYERLSRQPGADRAPSPSEGR